MKERPMLFSGEMVRAVLEDRKTKTRRVVKFDESGRVRLGKRCWHIEDPNVILGCPYGQPGDRLWVRETSVRFTGCAQNGKPWGAVPFMLSPDGDPYKAMLPIIGNEKPVASLNRAAACVTVPSIFMPRWASRINLEVVSVRVERVQDITEDDAMAEGVGRTAGYMGHRMCFKTLWDSINFKRGYGWDLNPLVWVVEFKRLP